MPAVWIELCCAGLSLSAQSHDPGMTGGIIGSSCLNDSSTPSYISIAVFVFESYLNTNICRNKGKVLIFNLSNCLIKSLISFVILAQSKYEFTFIFEVLP